MTSTYTTAGVTMDRFAEILASRIAAAILQWGESVDTSEEEFLGHELKLIATAQSDNNEIVQTLYDSLSIANASGAKLDNLVALVGLIRQPQAKSTAVLELTATGATTVPAGTLYETATKIQFATDVEHIFSGAGTAEIASTCTVFGANAAAINEINTIVTSITNISTVQNNAAAIEGSVRETDAEVKEAHAIATATSGQSDTGTTYEALRLVSGNTAAYANENDKAYAVGGIPANTTHYSVIGGTDNAIAAAIENNRVGSVQTYGATTVSLYNTTTGVSKSVNFDRATGRRHYMDLTITTINGLYPDDGETQIKDGLVAHFAAFRIAQNTVYNELYVPVFSVAGVIVTTMFVDITSSPTGVIDIVNSTLQLATLDADDIDITVS